MKAKFSKVVSLTTILSMSLLPSLAQPDTTATLYSYRADLPLVDLHFLRDAVGMRVNKRSGHKQGLNDVLQSYESPSMQQALALTKDLHAANYYVNNIMWEKILPLQKNKVWNRVAANTSAALVDLLFTYKAVVFSPQWLHEEFHRNGLTQRGIPSYDETYNIFYGGIANGSISRVRDEDMARFKKEDSPGMVRSFAAGIESEFLLMRELQKDNFFNKSNYPNIALNVLLTKHAVDYVNQFKRADYNNSIDSMNYYGREVMDRDFVGWDFTAWVYDLHRPFERYEERGIHPSGTGIDRAIKTTTLTPEEYQYLEKMGRMQYLNFLSPFMLGINAVRVNEDTRFNFAVRHYLNSFGYDLTMDILLTHKKRSLLMSVHTYRNKYLWLPGIELQIPAFSIRRHTAFTFEPRMILWTQPKAQLFHTKQVQPGMLLGLRTNLAVSRQLQCYVEGEGKTYGWVAGHPYLKSNLSFRLGLSMDVK